MNTVQILLMIWLCVALGCVIATFAFWGFSLVFIK